MADDARAGERVDERAQIAQRQRVDKRHTVVEEQLDHHEVRRVRLLGVKLGVEPDASGACDARAQRGERLGRVHQGDSLS